METILTPEIRTYENFSIRWIDGNGGGVSSFSTRAEAEDYLIDWNGARRPGLIFRKTWTVEVKPEFAHMYLPGI